MRYHYDPTSCQRSKVNSFFQFPFALNMGAYMESNLFPDRPQPGAQTDGSEDAADGMDVEEVRKRFQIAIGVPNFVLNSH